MAIDYLHNHLCMEKHPRTVDAVVRRLKTFGAERIDAIAFRGVSGAIVAPVVAYLLQKPIICVRKGEACHSGETVESPFSPWGHGKWKDGEPDVVPTTTRYAMIDDLVSSGETVKSVVRAISKKHPGSVCEGVFCYQPVWKDRLDVDGVNVPLFTCPMKEEIAI